MDLVHVKAMVFDVDGVFTDSKLHITENGQHLRVMTARDGYAVKSAIKQGLHIAIITGGESKGVRLRLSNLGIKDIYDGISDKPGTLKSFCKKHNYALKDILYMGDDYPDYKVLQVVGYPCCPKDAELEISKLCKYISPFDGGQGCVRDIIEKTLLAKGLKLYFESA